MLFKTVCISFCTEYKEHWTPMTVIVWTHMDFCVALLKSHED